MNRLASLLPAVLLALINPKSHGTSFTGLGDLPGGDFFSNAWAVSSDGSVVVGASTSSGVSEAFRWTRGGGMVGLGDLPGGDFASTARDVSADGSILDFLRVDQFGGIRGTFPWTGSALNGVTLAALALLTLLAHRRRRRA